MVEELVETLDVESKLVLDRIEVEAVEEVEGVATIVVVVVSSKTDTALEEIGLDEEEAEGVGSDMVEELVLLVLKAEELRLVEVVLL